MKNLIVLATVLSLAPIACSSNEKSSDKSSETPAASADEAQSPSGASAEPAGAGGANAEVGVPAQELVHFEVNATDKNLWVYLDLDTKQIVSETDARWDLAFKKTSIKMNGETVKGMVLVNGDFDAIVSTPAGEYASDQPVAGGKETDGLLFHSQGGWYSYDMETHVVSSQGHIFILKSNGGHDIKLKVLDYYNLDRLPAYVQLQWQAISNNTLSLAE